MNKWEISRRDVLKALGVGTACLPVLNATTSYAQGNPEIKRLIVHLQTEGYRRETWMPAAGKLATLPSSLQPLEAFKDKILVLGDLTNPRFPGCARWAHGAYGGIFTGGNVDPNSGNGKEYWEPLVKSVDQIVADHFQTIAPQLSQKSLAFGIGAGNTGRYPGSNRCFWSGPKQPVTPETDPYKVYSQIFAGRPAGTMTDPAADKMRVERKSLLDFVGKDLERFRARLGTEDRAVIDGHLDSIRALEKKLGASQQEIGTCGGVWSGNPAQPVAINTANTPMLWTLQMQLIVSALKCDVTRVGTTQVGDATGGAIIFDFVEGVPREGNGYQRFRDWHDLGHQPVRRGVPDGDDKSKVDKWTMGKFAELLGMLSKVPDGQGTMLDNTAVLWGNHMEDGSSHGAQKIPWIIAGMPKYFKLGHAFPNPGRAINGPMMEIATAMGVKLDFFNDANLGKPMPEIRAA